MVPASLSEATPKQVLSSNFNTLRTENGTASGYPIVATVSGTFYNYSSGWTPHHWSQMSSGTRGAGIMFTDTSNQKLYAFDSIPPGTPTGALKVNSGSINLLPVTLRDVEFTNALDIKWSGAVVTYHNTTPIYQDSDQTGLWVLAEYPPIITVTAES